MTDNEIIKALESAIHRYKDTTHHVSCIVDINIIKETLKFVQRQKAEIERLQDKLIISEGTEIKLRDNMYVLKDELQRAKVEISKHFDYMDEAANEAIKEFAERLKKELGFGHYIQPDQIDNLVKEMTEVQE